MTSCERLLSALRREPVDHVPCCASFNPLDETLRKGRKWNFPWPPGATAQEQFQYQVEVLGLDQVVNMGACLYRPVCGVVWHRGPQGPDRRDGSHSECGRTP
jgi:hypothetical protein